ncbi:hypothetical protein V8C35DRAFT_19555 [Trichoderma chlorosporum]
MSPSISRLNRDENTLAFSNDAMSRHISPGSHPREKPNPSFYYQHPPPSPHHGAASERRDRQEIGRASHHQRQRPLLARLTFHPLTLNGSQGPLPGERGEHFSNQRFAGFCLRPLRFRRGIALCPNPRCYPAANSCEALVLDDDGIL